MQLSINSTKTLFEVNSYVLVRMSGSCLGKRTHARAYTCIEKYRILGKKTLKNDDACKVAFKFYNI